jgi:hypothetical protein
MRADLSLRSPLRDPKFLSPLTFLKALKGSFLKACIHKTVSFYCVSLHAVRDMEFRFIDNNTPLDQHSQKLIRSHAMKGKNLGKTLPARGHKRRQRENEICSAQTRAKSEGLPKVQKGRLLLPKASKPDSANASANPEHMPLLRNHFCGAELSYFVTAEPFTSSSRYLFHECA